MLTQERLKELLHYDPETGVFTNRMSRGRAKAGAIAGCLTKGYVRICVDGRLHEAHRLAWCYVNGCWPREQIDHINCVKSDNRIANLREATNTENARNAPGHRNTKSGKKGVYPDGGRWRAMIYNNNLIHLGCYATIDEAHAAYAAAARIHCGDFARTE
jgi:hypothetical protein